MLPPRFKQRVVVTLHSHVPVLPSRIERFLTDAINEAVDAASVEHVTKDIAVLSVRPDKAEAL